MDAIDTLLTRGVDTIYPNKAVLEKVLRSGKKLTLYQGFDPTGTQFHIGHAVGLRKLRQWQDLGHKVIFLIGDFTATIGDPSGKKDSRPILTREKVLENAKEYQHQASKILRFDGDNPVKILFNSDWLSALSFADVISLATRFTVQQMIERDMFQERIKKGDQIGLHEFLYPLMVGYDSVAMNVDLEIGGTDQTFNMMAGRKLVSQMLKKEKFVMTVPLLTDSKGTKIGKTEGNVIGITDKPEEFYAKIMSLGDDAIIPCFTLLTDVSLKEIDEIKTKITAGDNPMAFKKQLAFELTKQLNTEASAAKAQKEFETVHQKRESTSVSAPVFKTKQTAWKLIDLLVATEMVTSKSEARRLIGNDAIEINGIGIKFQTADVTIKSHDIIKVGKKKFVKINIL